MDNTFIILDLYDMDNIVLVEDEKSKLPKKFNSYREALDFAENNNFETQFKIIGYFNPDKQ